MAAMTSGSSTTSPVTLRIVNVTDVYMLDNFPSLKTLIKEKKTQNINGPTISILTGDFLAPYLLSSMDFGKGMVNTMNATPIDYVIFGNHEHDLPHRHVVERVKDYTGTWINTNMQSHEAMPHQVDKAVVSCKSADGTHTRKVGLISMLTDQPGLYRPNAFGGATIDDPWVTAKAYNKKLVEEDQVDIVVPLCHLYEPQDEKTCRDFDEYPIIISGHDHHTVDRMVSGSRLVKAGSDGHKAAIIDITWNSPDATEKPIIDVSLVTVKDWKANEGLQSDVEKALSVLDNLRHTQLVAIPEKFRPLNSVGVRGAITSGGLFICSQYRDAFNADLSTQACDLVLMPGGNIRGGRLYEAGDHFSLESLKSEIHPKMDMSVLQIPGNVICESVRDSHTRGHHPYFMHYDDGVTVDPETHLVTHIQGEPLDPKRIYNVGYPTDELRAENGPVCIRDYFNANPPNPRHLKSTARGGQEFLLQFWAQNVWRALWSALDRNHDGKIDHSEFDKLDLDRSGKVDASELMAFMHKELGFDVCESENSFARFVIAAAGDADQDGKLSYEEMQMARKGV